MCVCVVCVCVCVTLHIYDMCVDVCVDVCVWMYVCGCLCGCGVWMSVWMCVCAYTIATHFHLWLTVSLKALGVCGIKGVPKVGRHADHFIAYPMNTVLRKTHCLCTQKCVHGVFVCVWGVLCPRVKKGVWLSVSERMHCLLPNTFVPLLIE